MDTEGEWITFTAKLRPEVARSLDREARSIGISRMDLIKVILAKHIESRS